jgi:hypothetical protein
VLRVHEEAGGLLTRKRTTKRGGETVWQELT